MSYYNVIVLGDAPEEQLKPFHEFESTGLDNEFVKDIDKTEYYREEWKSFKDVHKTLKDFVVWYDGFTPECILGPNEPLNEKCKFRYIRLDADGEVVSIIKRTNPNAKWDWFALSPNYFPTAGGYTSSCPFKEVDFEIARDEKRAVAIAKYDEWEKALSTSQEKTLSFAECLAKCDTREQAETLWQTQPAIQYMLSGEGWYSLEDPVYHFRMGREAYIQEAMDGALVPFAVIKDGTWYERGKMGWWAIVSEEKPMKEWQSFVREIYESLAPDTLVTCWRCHI